MNVGEPTVALVFSPERWVEELHRHLAHHGGARVRQIVVEPAVALDEEFDVLVVSDRWPALTLGFVGAIRERGRRVLGVFDPEEPAGKDHLVALGVDATIAADSPMPEFVDALGDLDVGAPATTVSRIVAPASDRTAVGPLVAVSGPRGAGITEVAVGLAAALGRRRAPVVLVDAHETAPAVAVRLGLGLEPNLRNAVDACAHGLGVLDATVVAAAAPAPRSLGVVAGFPSPVAAAQVTTLDVLHVVGALRDRQRHVVIDVDGVSSIATAVLDAATAIVAVVGASPIGVVRVLEWLAPVHRRVPGTPLHIAVNRAPAARFRREEIHEEIARTLTPRSITWLPPDRGVEAAAWDGELVARGPFAVAIDRLAQAVAPARPARRFRRPR